MLALSFLKRARAGLEGKRKRLLAGFHGLLLAHAAQPARASPRGFTARTCPAQAGREALRRGGLDRREQGLLDAARVRAHPLPGPETTVFGVLSALRARTKAPCKTDLHRKNAKGA